MRSAAASDDIVFLDEEETPREAPVDSVWKVLVVDDDEDIHRVTRLVLADLTFRDRRIELIPAYSSMAARTALAEQPDIAVILLDVVMETDDAGLKLVRFVREQLGNRKIRIILRTGQPGHAPELKVILDYDINDYRSKAELTSDRLVTALVAALRSYGDIDAAEQARWQSRQADEANTAKSTFLANMSHEIRTPLHAVIGNLELLTLGSLAPEQRRLAGEASVAAQALLDIIGDLLDLSKIEAGSLEIDTAETDVRGVLRDVVAITAPKAREKSLAFILHVGESVPRTIRTDAVRLRQILVNLVGNAVKFTSEGGVFVAVRRDGYRAGVARLRVEVVDTGIGFDPTRAADLFEPFVQEDSSTARRFGGTGLGLTISRRIVEQFGGSIGCSAEPGLGATFWCVIPALTESAGESPGAIDLSSCRVLLAGADGGRCEAVAAFLRRNGAIVDTGADAPAGPVTAVVLLAGRDADTAAALLSRAARHAKTRIALSTDDAPRTRYILHRRGASHVLSYPQQLEELPAILIAALAEANTPAPPSPGASMSFAPLSLAPPGGVVPRVLVIDDTATNRELAIRQLQQFGLAGDAAADGAAGLERAMARSYALILVDGSMPVMDGAHFTARLRDYERERGLPRTPIVAMTAHALAGDAERFRAVGMDDHLAKPVTLERLGAALARWIPPADGPALDAALPAAIDRASLVDLLGGLDPEALAGLLAIFREDLPTLLAPIESALAAGDRAGLAEAAHAGRSAAGSAAAVRLAALLGRLEQGAALADPAALATLVRAIEAEFRRVDTEIAEVHAPARPPADAKTTQ